MPIFRLFRRPASRTADRIIGGLLAPPSVGYADRFPIRSTNDSMHPAPTSDEAREQFRRHAYLGWAVHLHEEIHSWVRTYQLMFQLVATIAAAAATAAATKPAFTTAILIASPYVIGTALAQWATSLREVMINAAVLDEIEDALHADLGDWVLFQETIVGHAPPNLWGSLVNNGLMAAAYLGTAVASIVTAFKHVDGWYAALDLFGITLITAAVLINSHEAHNARSRIRLAAQDLRQRGSDGDTVHS